MTRYLAGTRSLPTVDARSFGGPSLGSVEMPVRNVYRASAVCAGLVAVMLGTAGAALADDLIGTTTTTLTSATTTVTSTTTTVTGTVTGTSTDIIPLPSPTLSPITSVLPTTSPLPTVSPLPTLLPSPSSTPTAPTAPLPTTTSAPLSGVLPGGTTTTSGSAPTSTNTGTTSFQAAGLPRLPRSKTPTSGSAGSSYLPQVYGSAFSNAPYVDRLNSYALRSLGDIPALASQPIQLSAGSAPALAPVPGLPKPGRIAPSSHDTRTILGGLAVIVAMVAVGSLAAGHISVWLENRRRRLAHV